jgi:hypothetical protein
LRLVHHFGIADEHRDDADLAGERRADFDAHEVIGQVEPAPTFVGRADPCGSDDGNQRHAGAHGALDVRHEIHADADLADVAEEHAGVGAVETVVEPSRLRQRVAATIADEDLWLTHVRADDNVRRAPRERRAQGVRIRPS